MHGSDGNELIFAGAPSEVADGVTMRAPSEVIRGATFFAPSEVIRGATFVASTRLRPLRAWRINRRRFTASMCSGGVVTGSFRMALESSLVAWMIRSVGVTLGTITTWCSNFIVSLVRSLPVSAVTTV